MKIEHISKFEGVGAQVVISVIERSDPKTITPTSPEWPRANAAGQHLKERLELDPKLELVSVDKNGYQRQFSFKYPSTEKQE